MRHFELNKDKTVNGAIGQSIPHESAIKHVCGNANYLDDNIVPSNCLYGYPVVSSITAGSIMHIDTSALGNIEGVVKVLSHQDIPGKKDIGPVFPGDTLLADDLIQYHSQPILLVVATTFELARHAASLVKVTYSESTPVLDIHQAINEKSWVRPPHSLTKGNADSALKNAVHTISSELHIGGQEHFYLEGQVALAQPNQDGGMWVQTSTQHPTEVQHLVAKVLNQPFHYATVETRRMGGAFGGKETQAAPWACLAALACYHTGKAVKVKLSRSDDFKLTGKRHPFFNKYQVGFNEDGLIDGVAIEINGNCGYSPDLSDAIVDRAMFHADNAYFYPNATITGNRCKTNTVSHTAFRGFGGPQGVIVAEMMMDDIAYSIGKDPIEVRKLNLYKKGSDTTPYHQVVEQHVLLEMINQIEYSADYHQRKAQIKEFNKHSSIIKKGLGVSTVKFGISFTVQHLNQAGALLHIYSDGSLHINHGGTEMGQGLNTKIAQIVAHGMGIDVKHVGITATRTDKVPNTSPTAASSGTDLNGMAALNAVNTLKQRLTDFVAAHFDVEADSIEFKNDNVYHQKGDICFAELIGLAYLNRVSLSTTGYYATPKIHYDRDKAQGHPFFYYANGVAISEVEIDTLTGENSVLRTDILHDVGNSLNPALDIGQIEGAFIQGMGWLTTEELQWNEQGKLTSFGPATYKIPAIGDTPSQLNVELFNSKNPETTVFRSKAVGEPPFMHGISVWCAIRNAIASINDEKYCPKLDTPATPERILNAVVDAQQWQNTPQDDAGAEHA